ncbi:MAG: hypothetical protein RIS47_2255 [Bacteroidota bacterium]|jgi:hypothetical protein
MKKLAILLILAVGLSSGCSTIAKIPGGNDLVMQVLTNALMKKDFNILKPLTSSNFSLGSLLGNDAITAATSTLTGSGNITDVLLKGVEQKGAETILNTVMKVDGTETPSTVKLDNGGKISSISYLTDLFLNKK